MRHIQQERWANIRDQISDKQLVDIIDQIAPGEDLKLFVAEYHYGDFILKNGELQLPDETGHLRPISSDQIPKHLRTEFKYNYYSNPVTLVLNGAVELFSELKNRIVPFYGVIPTGSLFGTWLILAPSYRTMEPTFNWQMTAGARSIFMLPKISSQIQHDRLIKTLHLQCPPPGDLADHFEIFRQISNTNKQAWSTQLLYFGQNWFKNLEDPIFKDFHNYLFKCAWQGSNFFRNRFIEDMLISFSQDYRGIVFDVNAINRLRHILAIAGGFHNGFSCVSNDEIAPISLIQKTYREIYGLKYKPIIISQKLFDLDSAQETSPTYYSLNFENCQAFHPKPQGNNSLLKELLNMQYTYQRLEKTIPKVVLNLEPSVLAKIFANINFTYIHTHGDGREQFIHPQEVPKYDPEMASNPFPNNAPFFKGAIMISKNK